MSRWVKVRTGETPVLPGRADNAANSRSGVSPDIKESLNLGYNICILH